MSIAFERNNSSDHRIERSVFVHGMTCVPIYKSPEFTRLPAEEEEEEDDRSSLSSSSSSIGRNSDEESAERSSSAGDDRKDEGDDDGEDEEVQSVYKGRPLESLEALEEVLPVKRSISKFYCGKSKSFTSLGDAATISSIKEIVKPENAYTRKRKNLLAYNIFLDNSRSNILRSNSGGLSKRPTNSRSTLALAATMSSSESNTNECPNTNSSSPALCLPPLPPHTRRSNNESLSSSPEQKFCSWRSFSLSDLQGAVAITPGMTGLSRNNLEKSRLS